MSSMQMRIRGIYRVIINVVWNIPSRLRWWEFAKDLVIWDLSYQDPFSDVYYDYGVILDECVHRITTGHIPAVQISSFPM